MNSFCFLDSSNVVARERPIFDVDYDRSLSLSFSLCADWLKLKDKNINLGVGSHSVGIIHIKAPEGRTEGGSCCLPPVTC